jgi:putative transposase
MLQRLMTGQVQVHDLALPAAVEGTMTYDRQKHHRRSIRLQGYDYAQPGAYFITICTQGGEALFGEIVSGRMCLNAAGEMVWRWWAGLNDKYPSVRTDAAIVMPNHFHGIIVITGDPKPGQQGQPHRAAPTNVPLDTTVGPTQPGYPQTNATVGATPRGRPDTDTAVGPTPRGRPHTDTTVGTTQPSHPQTNAIVGATPRGRPDTDTAVGPTPRGRPHTDTTVGTTQPSHPQTNATVGATPRGRPRGRPQGDHPNPKPHDPPPTLGQIVGWFKTMTTNEYIRGVKQLGWPPFPGKVWQRNYYEHIIRNRQTLDRIRAYIQTNPKRWSLDRENPQRQGLDELESWIYGPPSDEER